MVVIAIDYGEKKIGLAVGNTETMTSSPISIIKKAKTGFNWDELKEKIMEWEPNRIIIGKPLNMDGTRSDFMEKVERFAKKLRSIIDIEIEFFDEQQLKGLEGRLVIDDQEAVADAGFPGEDPLSLITELANHMSNRSSDVQARGLRSDDIITTGSWTGVDFATQNSAIKAYFSKLGSATLEFTS
ncbi:MAG: Holliday junction resolvase RuvX [Rhodospirillaceae bacterium]|nr:Holliday junction resolvase RuvX [Rhodospirillaceae bacterium]